jgi:hypothetical protein
MIQKYIRWHLHWDCIETLKAKKWITASNHTIANVKDSDNRWKLLACQLEVFLKALESCRSTRR